LNLTSNLDVAGVVTAPVAGAELLQCGTDGPGAFDCCQFVAGRGGNVKILREAAFVVIVAAIPLTAFVAVADADPAPPVAPHRHYKINGNGGKVYIGPNFCDMDANAQGFYNFHANVHENGLSDRVFGEPCQ
jgi:hypothetical protein